MPSVADVQQQTTKLSLNTNNGKSTPTIQQQQQQSNSTSSGNQIDTTNVDPITQAILLLEKKQRNLGKRKEKLESYQQIAKSGKELNKDQTEALAKYGDVVGQIECVKDIYEQVKKIQTDSAKSQKRLLKQAAEEKRLFATQRLREYVQLRYLLDHQPSSLKAEESKLFDELVPVVVPSDNSLNTINRAVETVLAIYQGGPASTTIKNLTGRTSQEVRETLEQLIQSSQLPTITSNNQPIQQQQQPEIDNTKDVVVPSINETQQLVQTNPTEYPLTFDTRNQNIPLQQIIQDNTFFPVDILTTNNTQNQQESTTNQDNQSNDHKQFVQTQSISQQQNYDQENSANLVHDDQQHAEDQWQQRRSNNATGGHRGGNYNGSANRNYNRGGATAQNNYNQQQHWRGGSQRGGAHYDNSYNAGQRQYHENSNRAGPNPNYRGNRGGNNYRGGNRGGNAGYNGNGYQKSNQYQQNNEQQQQHQVRSAPSNKQQQQQQ